MSIRTPSNWYTRRGNRVIAASLTSLMVAVGITWTAADADAQRRRRRAPAEERTPMSDAVAPALDGIEWGWDHRHLVKHHTAQIRRQYQPRINKARDAMTEDALRHERDQILRRMRESRLEFNGRTSGYDSGFLRDEFTHRNQESMIRVRGENGDDYFFFIQGRLWKWYHAFDAAVFQGADFEQFTAALQRRFGPGRTRTGHLSAGTEERTWMEWQDETTRVRAVDNTTFYGFYGLIFEDKATLARLGELRQNKRRSGPREHALVEAVTADGEETSGDSHSDIIDRITGNIRNRQDAPPSE